MAISGLLGIDVLGRQQSQSRLNPQTPTLGKANNFTQKLHK
jgi:hypothetical protein